MRTHTNNFKTEIKEFGREFDDKLYYTSNGTTTTYTQENINSVNYFVDTSLLKSVMQTLTIDSDLDLEVDNTIDYGCTLANDEIRYNNFIIVKKEEQKDTNSYLYTCYDNMIKAMKEYNTFLNATSDVTFIDNKNYYELDNNIYTLYNDDRTGNPTSLGLYESSFPMTIRSYLNVICTRLGITFDNTQTFTNYDKNVLSEHYVDVELNSLGYTYRDVLDDIAEATGSFICIDNNGYLVVKGITNTNDTIDEEYFSEDNVNIGKKYGPINVVVLSRGSGADNLVRPTTTPQNPTEIKIENNPILEQTNREDYIDGIYNNLNGLEFYLNDLNSTGVMYYEVGDKYNIKIDDTYYPCLLLSDNMTRDDGLNEKIYTNEPTTSVSDYKYASNTDKIEKQSRNAYFLADKANGVAEMIVEGIGSNGQVTGASVIASINGDTSNLKLTGDHIDITGATSFNNNVIINQDGTIDINDGSIELVDNTSTGNECYLKIRDVNSNNLEKLFSNGLEFKTSNSSSEHRAYLYSFPTFSHFALGKYSTSQGGAVVSGMSMYQFDAEPEYGLDDRAELIISSNGHQQSISDTGVMFEGFLYLFKPGYTDYIIKAYDTGKIETKGELEVNGQLTLNGYAKPLTVESIKTKNLLEFANRTYTTNNITTTTYNGTISISGTFSTQTSFTFDITPVTLEAGKTYTFAKNQSNNGHYPYLILKDANSNIISTDYQNSVVSYTPTSNVTLTRLQFVINGNDAINSVLYPQLEEGSVATDWCEHKNLTYSSGQNSNGNYIKYDDGTLIQWGVIAKSNYLNSSTTSTSVQGINWYRSTIYALYFPYEFIDENYSLTLSAQCGTNGSRFIMTDTLTKRVRYFESQLIGVENFTSSGTGYTNLTNVSWIAIGRWK